MLENIDDDFTLQREGQSCLYFLYRNAKHESWTHLIYRETFIRIFTKKLKNNKWFTKEIVKREGSPWQVAGEQHTCVSMNWSTAEKLLQSFGNLEAHFLAPSKKIHHQTRNYPTLQAIVAKLLWKQLCCTSCTCTRPCAIMTTLRHVSSWLPVHLFIK